MKISENTLKILKNYVGINPSVLMRAGSIVSTKSIAGNIVAEATVEEEFPVEFALYDLNEFLNTIKLFKSPVLDFSDAESNFLSICEEDNLEFKVKYTFANKEHIKYPERRAVLDDPSVSFKLDSETLNSITKASSIMQLPNMIILPIDESHVQIEVSDVKDRSSNKFSIALDAEAPANAKFKLIYKMDNLKMLPGEYEVRINGELKRSAFESDLVDYFIGLEMNSRF